MGREACTSTLSLISLRIKMATSSYCLHLQELVCHQEDMTPDRIPTKPLLQNATPSALPFLLLATDFNFLSLSPHGMARISRIFPSSSSAKERLPRITFLWPALGRNTVDILTTS